MNPRCVTYDFSVAMNSLMMRLRLSTFGKGDDVRGDAKVPPAAHTGPLAMTELSSSLLEDSLVRLELSSSLLDVIV